MGVVFFVTLYVCYQWIKVRVRRTEVLVTYTTNTATEWLDCGLLDGPTSVTYADTPVSVAVGWRSDIVDGSGSGVVGHGARQI